jgi:hypothetical protein
MRSILLAAVLVGGVARAQLPDPCRGETARLCRDVVPGQGRIISCLIANLANIQDAACRANTQAIRDRQAAVSRDCRAEIDAHCPGKGFGTGIMVCLDRYQSVLSPGCHEAVSAMQTGSPAPSPGDAALAITAQDRIVSDAAGDRWVVTAHNGVAHPLMHLGSGEANPIYKVTKTSQNACKTKTITTAPKEKRVMLDDLGYVPPAKDQTGRATCNVFSVVALLETEYLIQYFKMTHTQYLASHQQMPFSLSEQYLQSLKVETHTALHDLGSSVDNLLRMAPFCGGAAPMYGLPPETIWPYINSDVDVMSQMRPSLPQAPADFAAFFGMVSFEMYPVTTPPTVGANGRPSALNVDLTNYSWSNAAPPDNSGSLASYAAVYPPPGVHESAQYAPVDVIQLNVSTSKELAACKNKPMKDYSVVSSTDPMVKPTPPECVAALAAPIEAVLAQHHPIAYFTDWELYHVDPKMKAFVYSNPDDKPLNFDHCMLLIGYDREKQVFRFKNSWGPGWNGNGKAEMTYDLFFRMLSGSYPAYAEKVWDPNKGALPNGIWRGFWQGTLRGIQGVAVIHHLGGVDDQDLAISDGGMPAGSFYGADSSQTDFQYLDWNQIGNSYSVRFGDQSGKPLFTLTRSIGSPMPDATFTDLTDSKAAPAQWRKCSSNGPGVGMQLQPSTYLDTLNDPYVLPPCVSYPTWHTAPTWSCPSDEIFDGSIPYNRPNKAGTKIVNDWEPGCVKLDKTAPSCPAGKTLLADVQVVDTGITTTGVVSPTSTKETWQDVCSPPQKSGAPPTTHRDSDGKFDQLGCSPPFCATPTCPTPSDVFGDPSAVLKNRAAGGVWSRKGDDRCIHAIHKQKASCATPYLLAPGGADCVVPVKPGPPSPNPRNGPLQ